MHLHTFTHGIASYSFGQSYSYTTELDLYLLYVATYDDAFDESVTRVRMYETRLQGYNGKWK